MANCGGYKNSAEWAKNDPEGLIKAMNKSGSKAAALINKAGPQALKGFMAGLGKDLANPFGWLGGDVIFSTMFSAEAEARGKTPLEALDEGLLWFLPKGVIDAKKKALFGYEGTPSGMYKMKGYAGAYSQDQIEDMKNYLDLEESDRKYFEAINEKEVLEKKGYKELGPEKGYYDLTSKEKNLKKDILDLADIKIEKYGDESKDSVTQIYERNTGLRTEDGTPRMKEMYREDFQSLMQKTSENLWDVQQQYAIDEINRKKQGDLNLLYAKKKDPLDLFAGPTAQLPFGMGETGRISTLFTDPIDLYRASSPLKAGERLPPGIKQSYQKILDLWNMGLISQEEKERYAEEMGREDLLHKEYKHPLYGPSYSAEQISGVFPEYFQGASGGIANLTRTVAPDSGPVSRGLRSLYIDDMD